MFQSYDYISLFVSFIDIPVGLDNLFQRIASILRVFHHQHTTKRRHRRAKQRDFEPYCPSFRVLLHPLYGPFAFIAPLMKSPFLGIGKGSSLLQGTVILLVTVSISAPRPRKAAPTRCRPLQEAPLSMRWARRPGEPRGGLYRLLEL